MPAVLSLAQAVPCDKELLVGATEQTGTAATREVYKDPNFVVTLHSVLEKEEAPLAKKQQSRVIPTPSC